MTIGGLEAILNSNPGESYEYLMGEKNKLGITLGITLALMVLYLYLIRQHLPGNLKIKKKHSLVFLLLFIPALALAGLKPGRIYPVIIANLFYEYFSNTVYISELKHINADQDFKVRRKTDFNKKEIHVIVIGESMRKAQLPYYGYQRETTPLLNTVSDLIYFNDVISPATLTIPSITTILTSLTACEASSYSNLSVLLLAKKMNFRTVWISNQCRAGRWEAKISAIAEAADETFFVNTTCSGRTSGQYDENLLPFFKQVLSGQHEKKLIIIHLFGSHGAYDKRYPESFDHFKEKADNRLTEKEAQIINAYDNSIRYTDYILYELLMALDKTKAVSSLVYLSDHGENLYDDDRKNQGHGGLPVPTSFEVEIPMFVWFSKTFDTYNPVMIKNALNNIDKPVSSENLFYAVADLLNIDFQGMDTSKSFFNSAYLPEKRMIFTPKNECIPYESIFR